MPTVTEEACSFINHEESCASAKIFPKTWRLPSVDFADTTLTHTHTHNTSIPTKSLANKRGARQLIRGRREREGCISHMHLARETRVSRSKSRQEYEERG